MSLLVCRRHRRRLVAWLDGELAAAESEAIAAHVQSCERCAGLAERLEATRPVPPRWPELPSSFWEPMERALAVEMEAPAPPPRSWRIPPRLTISPVLAAGYLAALAIAVGWGIESHLARIDADHTRAEAIRELEHYRRMASEPVQVALPAARFRTASYVPYRDTY